MSGRLVITILNADAQTPAPGVGEGHAVKGQAVPVRMRTGRGFERFGIMYLTNPRQHGMIEAWKTPRPSLPTFKMPARPANFSKRSAGRMAPFVRIGFFPPGSGTNERSRLFCALLLSAAALLPQSGPVESETAVIQAERGWNDAYLRSDFAKLKAIRAGDYMDVTDDGTFDTRTTNLRSIKSGEEKFTALSVSNVMTRIYGDVAINTGALHMELLFRGVPSGGDFLFTDIWQKRKGS